jgi:hypothetical protein
MGDAVGPLQSHAGDSERARRQIHRQAAHCPSTVESSDVALDPKVRAANLGLA